MVGHLVWKEHLFKMRILRCKNPFINRSRLGRYMRLWRCVQVYTYVWVWPRSPVLWTKFSLITTFTANNHWITWKRTWKGSISLSWAAALLFLNILPPWPQRRVTCWWDSPSRLTHLSRTCITRPSVSTAEQPEPHAVTAVFIFKHRVSWLTIPSAL